MINSIAIGLHISRTFIIGKISENGMCDVYGIHLIQSGNNITPQIYPLLAPFSKDSVDISNEQIIATKVIEDNPELEPLVNDYRLLVSGIVVAKNIPHGE